MGEGFFTKSHHNPINSEVGGRRSILGRRLGFNRCFFCSLSLFHYVGWYWEVRNGFNIDSRGQTGRARSRYNHLLKQEAISSSCRRRDSGIRGTRHAVCSTNQLYQLTLATLCSRAVVEDVLNRPRARRRSPWDRQASTAEQSDVTDPDSSWIYFLVTASSITCLTSF